VKAVSELFSPVAGKVAEINSALVQAPEAINSDPYGAGWMVKLELKDAAAAAQLMDAAAYRKFVESESR
jgi:glycine cleavage system H protein